MSKVFLYSSKDLILVSIALSHLALIVTVVVFYNSLNGLTLFFLGALHSYLVCLSFQCVGHNFFHNPFFKNKHLNDLFGLFNSLCLGGSNEYVRYHHLNHHRHNNDRPTSYGVTKDMNSIYRYGKNGKAESLIPYVLLTHFRVDFKALSKSAGTKGYIQWVFFTLFVICMGLYNYEATIWYVAFTYLGGYWLSALQNYSEHVNATPEDKYRDSVSCYGKVYNLLWFNNGYHQEHHFSAKTHWTKIKEVTSKIPSIEDRFCINTHHFFNYVELDATKK